MITIENIAPYIPYGLKVQHTNLDPEDGTTIIDTAESLSLDCLSFRKGADYYFEEPDGIEIKPLLYPSLTTPITHKGETFVPIVELAKLAYPCFEWVLNEELAHAEIKLKEIGLVFWYEQKSFFTVNETLDDNNDWNTPNQLLLFRKCYEWKINLEGIESVDPGTLDVNPYE